MCFHKQVHTLLKLSFSLAWVNTSIKHPATLTLLREGAIPLPKLKRSLNIKITFGSICIFPSTEIRRWILGIAFPRRYHNGRWLYCIPFGAVGVARRRIREMDTFSIWPEYIYILGRADTTLDLLYGGSKFSPGTRLARRDPRYDRYAVLGRYL